RIVSRPAAKDDGTPGTEEAQITISRRLRVWRDDLDARLHQVRPVPDVFRISFSDDENDGRVIGERSIRQSINPPVLDESLLANSIDIDDRSDRDNVSLQPVDDSSCLRAGTTMRLFNGHFISRFLLITGNEVDIDISPEFPRRIVGDVQQLD